MKLKDLTMALISLALVSGCSGLNSASKITGSTHLNEQETSLKNAVELISMHAYEDNAKKSLATIKSCKLNQGDLLTVKHLYKLKYEMPYVFNPCWDNIVSYMKNGDTRVKKGGVNYNIAQDFLKHWKNSSL